MIPIIDPSFFIIGAGRAGASIAYYLGRRGYRIASLVERQPARLQYLRDRLNWPYLTETLDPAKLSQSEIVLLMVQDDHIAEVAEHLSHLNVNWNGKVVAHMSGAFPSTVLAPLREKGAVVASVHAIYAFSEDPRENRHLDKIWFNMEGDEDALAFFQELFTHTGNKVIHVQPDQKQAIHIASVFYANFYVSIAEMSRVILKNKGFSSDDIFAMLSPLLTSSVDQVLRHGTAGALTGPIKRGDVKTLRSHLDYLRANHPELHEAYKLLSRFLLPISGLPEKDREELKKLFE